MSEEQHTVNEDAPSSGYRLLDRLNQIALKIYGAADRVAPETHGAGESERAHAWYEECQKHFVIERDEHGNEYLYHRDDFRGGPRAGTSRN